MKYLILTYVLYLSLSLLLTIWVARTLQKNGRIFLVECFRGNEGLADSVNHLLVVGFYLINGGFVALFLKTSPSIQEVWQVFEVLSGKLGVVLLVLGGMHFFNLLILSKARRSGLRQPPSLPGARI